MVDSKRKNEEDLKIQIRSDVRLSQRTSIDQGLIDQRIYLESMLNK